jgi:Zn-dependent protease with chaperone function
MAVSNLAQRQLHRVANLTLFKSLLLPVALLVFFSLAPYWLSYNLRNEMLGQISSDQKLNSEEKAQAQAYLEKVDFQALCFNPTPNEKDLHDEFVESGIPFHFQRLDWYRNFSIAWVLILFGSAALLHLLNLKARRSTASLIGEYQLGYRIVIAASFINLLFLFPLLAFASFEATTIALNEYFPKVLIAIVIGGIAALVQSMNALMKVVPMEFPEPMSRVVTPEEAPELWQVVRHAAESLKTAPPDHIVVGLQLNFYVTELSVVSPGGRTEGRTLFLSYPILRQLSEQEALSIIGHELGHFIGQDTAMTRQFYPLRFKLNHSMYGLAQSGLLGWPSLKLLQYFSWSFSETVQAASRSREFLADATGAALTSPDTTARALVKFHVVEEVFNQHMNAALKDESINPVHFQMHSAVQRNLPAEAEFWPHLFQVTLPHPLDSHPPLSERLDSLKEIVTPAAAREMALQETPTAYAAWFPNRDDLLTPLLTAADTAMVKIRAQAAIHGASSETSEGKALLDRHFPELIWPINSGQIKKACVLLSLVAVFFLFLVYIVDDRWIGSGIFAIALFFGGMAARIWITKRNARIILNVDSFHYTYWREPILFKNLTHLSISDNNGVQLVFHFKESRKPLIRYSLPFKRKTAFFPLRDVQQKQDLVDKTYRYFHRQMD